MQIYAIYANLAAQNKVTHHSKNKNIIERTQDYKASTSREGTCSNCGWAANKATITPLIQNKKFHVNKSKKYPHGTWILWAWPEVLLILLLTECVMA